MLDLQAEQHGPGQSCAELYEAVADLKRRHDLHPSALRPGDGMALRRDSERDAVLELVKRFRDLPAEQRRRLPALLNSLAQLEMVVGDLEDGQSDFQEVARIAEDARARAEAHHNAYLAAIERCDWRTALADFRRAAALDEALAPFPLGRYDPVRVLGAGGAGVTFLCADRERGDRCVIKALCPDCLDHDVATLFREMTVVRELDHPALGKVRDVACAGPGTERPYLVLDYFEGQTLEALIAQNGPLAPEDALAVLWPVGRAVHALHDRGVLHRCLRAGSVLVRREKTAGARPRLRVRLLDPGLMLKRSLVHAIASHRAAVEQTALGHSIARLVPYLPSEIVGRPKGQVWVGPHSDVYGFGRLCSLVLSGNPCPDRAELVLLSDEWKQFLEDCTAWVFRRRPEHFGLVLDRLANLAGAGEMIGTIERDLHEAALADHTAAIDADPTSANAWADRGNLHLRQGDQALAVADFTRALELRPNDPGLLRRRALAHWRSNDLDAALADYSEAMRLEPRNVETLANRGLVYAQKGDQNAAIADYTEALHHSPRDDVLYYNRGNSHYMKGELDQAIADYSEAVRIEPRHAWAFGNRGKAYALRGEHQRALADYNRTLQLEPGNLRALCDRAGTYAELGQRERALADYTEALKRGPSPALYIDRGLLRAGMCDPEGAIADFTEALALDANHAGAFLLRGNIHADRNELAEAAADYSEVIRIDPRSATAYYNRGNVRARQSDTEGALADYGSALQIDPAHAAAYFNRGNLHCDRGNLEQAVADYSQAIRLAPGDAAAYTNRGNALVNMGDLDNAVVDYSRALEIEANDPLTLCNRGNTYARLGRFDQALADYSQALRLAPENGHAHNARGNVLAELGRLDEALADYARAIELEPNFPRSYHNRGNVHADRGELDRAIADFSEALRLDPRYAAAWFNRANARAATGDHAGAVADFSEALRLEPNHAGALNNRGNSHQRLGDEEHALADFAAAIIADPKFSLPHYNRANLLCRRGAFAEALVDYTEAIRLGPGDVAAYHSRGRLHTLLGNYEQAITDNLEALKLRPGDPRSCNNLAWLWATCPRAQLRDGARAVEHARLACEATGWQDAGFLDTLAAAYATAGQFDQAIVWQNKAMELAGQEAAAEYEARLRLFEAGQPYVEPSAATGGHE